MDSRAPASLVQYKMQVELTKPFSAPSQKASVRLYSTAYTKEIGVTQVLLEKGDTVTCLMAFSQSRAQVNFEWLSDEKLVLAFAKNVQVQSIRREPFENISLHFLPVDSQNLDAVEWQRVEHDAEDAHASI